MRKLRYIGRYVIEDKTLGKGNFAVVELASHTITKTKVAIKVIDRHKIKEEYVRLNLGREARILAQLRHPNVVRLYEIISSSSLYCLVTEYVGGGDLLSFVRSQRDGRLRESDARPFVRQLVSALHHLHERGVVHRDLKMENIMLDSRKKKIKIVDFGLSNCFSADQLLQTHCGSPEYAAPELFTAGNSYYGPEVDIWSLGINIYAMVFGKLPFTTPHSANRRQRLLQQLQYGLGPIQEKEMSKLTSECRELLHYCIEPNSELRAPLLDIEVQPWITDNNRIPFFPYQQPRRDRALRRQIIHKMSTLLNVSENKIESNVHEYRLDEVSAIYNILMDDYLSCKQYWNIDHTSHGIKPPNNVAGGGEIQDGFDNDMRGHDVSKTPSTDAENLRVSLRTPTIIGMVRPSENVDPKVTYRRSLRSADFELRAINNAAEKARKRRPKTTCATQSSSKARPIGNATTKNIVIARKKNYSAIHEHLLCGDCQTQREKIKRPAAKGPPKVVDVPNAGMEVSGAMREEQKHSESSNHQEERGEQGRSVKNTQLVMEIENECQMLAQCDKVCNESVNKHDMDKEECADEKPCAAVAKSPQVMWNAAETFHSDDSTSNLVGHNISESQKEVKVIDMVQYFNSKHGYRISETPFVFPRGKSAQSNRTSQREHADPNAAAELLNTPHLAVTYKPCTPYSGPGLRKEDETQPPTTIDIKLPRNDEGYQSDSESERGRSATPQKARWRPRFYQMVRRSPSSSNQSPTRQQCRDSSPPPPTNRAPNIDRPLYCTPVASFQTTQDLFDARSLQVAAKEPSVVEDTKKNRMPQRTCWKKDATETKSRKSTKTKEIMQRNNLHEKYPQEADIRIRSAQLRIGSDLKSPRSAATSGSSSAGTNRLAKSHPCTATSRQNVVTSPRHATCSAKSTRNAFRMETYTGHSPPQADLDMIEISKQHLLTLLQEASTTLENVTKMNERQQCQSQLHYYHQTSHQRQPEKSWQKAMSQLKPHHHDSTLARISDALDSDSETRASLSRPATVKDSTRFTRTKITDSLDSDSEPRRRSSASRPATVRALGKSRQSGTRSAGGSGISKQLGQRVTYEEGNLNPDTGRPPSVLSSENKQPVFNMDSSRPVAPQAADEKINYRLPKMSSRPNRSNVTETSQEWSVGYALERKLSNTLKGGDKIAQMRRTPYAI